MRHVKLRPDDDLDGTALRELIRAAYEDVKERLDDSYALSQSRRPGAKA